MNWNEIFKNTTAEFGAEERTPEEKTGSLLGAVIGAAAVPSNEAEEVAPQPETEPVPGEENVETVCTATVHMRITSMGDVAKAALYLAMSDDISEERRIK